MPRLALAALLATLLSAAALRAEDAPVPEAPRKEHEWLQQFVGEWESEAEASLGPDQPPLKCKGSETVRSLGGRWIVAELENSVMGHKVSAVLTVGYDPRKGKYVGTWVDSMQNHLWVYEGTVDAAGKVITLEAEGPSFTDPGKTAKYRDAVEFKSKDHRVLTSSVLGEDGRWVTFMTADYRRKK